MSEGRFNLSALAVRERSITLFLIILITVAGILSFFELGRAEDPPFTVKQMTIITAWPGATAQEMQDQVAEPLEKRLQELKWYDRSETYTRPGLAFTLLSLQDSTPPSQVQEEFYQARKKLGDEAGNLPAGVTGPMINDEFSDVTFALFALKAKGEPQRLLARDAESLRQQLLHVPGVKRSISSANRPNVSLFPSPMTDWPRWALPLKIFSPPSTVRICSRLPGRLIPRDRRSLSASMAHSTSWTKSVKRRSSPEAGPCNFLTWQPLRVVIRILPPS